MLNKKYVPHDLPIYPLHYHSKSKGDSDRDWILKRMRVISKDKQQEVSNEYEKLYRSEKFGNRQAANTFLQELAVKYRNKSK